MAADLEALEDLALVVAPLAEAAYLAEAHPPLHQDFHSPQL